MTSIFILTRIFSNPLSNVFQKKLAGNAFDPLFIILTTHFLLTLLSLPILLYVLPLNLSSIFWGNIIICALLAIAGNTLIVIALKSTDLSVLGPINAYKSIISVLLGIFILDEFPTVMGVAGILMILFGSYFIIENDPNKGGKNIFSQFFENKGVLFRIAALILSATEAIFLKRALLLSSPLVTFLFWCILGLPIAYIARTFMLKVRIQNKIGALKQKKMNFLLLATTTGLMQLSTLYTFGVLQVSYSLALFQISTLLSVLFGYKFFQEKKILKKLFGAIVMVLGAVLIITFGSRS